MGVNVDKLGARAAGAGTSRPIRQPIDIEDLLVWTYRDQRADVVIGRGAGLHGPEAAMDDVALQAVSSCGCATVERIARLGVRVDRMGYDPGALHPDAETVHRMVLRMEAKVAGLPRSRLVISNAARAERPEHLVREVPRPVPVLNHMGEPRVDYRDKGRRYGTCPVSFQPSWAMIEAARMEYHAWWRTLATLALLLHSEGRLVRWHPLSPAAPERPWESA